jgi:hypothetical protein
MEDAYLRCLSDSYWLRSEKHQKSELNHEGKRFNLFHLRHLDSEWIRQKGDRILSSQEVL